MSAEELDNYEAEVELSLYAVELIPHTSGGDVYYEVRMSDAWVWDMYRAARFVRYVRVITYKDVNIEELDKPDMIVPE